METCGYRITIEGEAISPRILSLRGQPQEAAPGDVLIAHGVPPIVLGTATTINLRNTAGDTGLVMWDTGEGQPGSAIACHARHARIKQPGGPGRELDRVGQKSEHSKPDVLVFVNPLDRLTRGELASLRGISLESWNPILETYLGRLDLEQCAVSIDRDVFRCLSGRLPPLPQALRYLLIEFSAWSPKASFDLSALSGFPNLRVLVLPTTALAIDLGLLTGLTHLRVLHLRSARVTGLEHLSAFQELRDLDLAGCDCVDDLSASVISALPELRRLGVAGCGKLTSVAFARSLKTLEFIDVSQTGVADLTLLGDLPSLREIIAVKTPVRALPKQRLSRLLAANVMSSGIASDAIAEFRRLHPEAKVVHLWVDALRGAVIDADHVRVRSGGTCHRQPEKERTLAEESGKAAVRQLLSMLEIDEQHSGGYCMCCGHPTIEFRRGGHLVAQVGLHHGRSARWYGWPGDAVLTLRSRDQLAVWLAERGERSFWDANRDSRSLEMAEEALTEDCLSMLPPRTAELWRTGGAAQEGGAAGVREMLGSETSSVVMVRGPNVVGGKGGTDSQVIAAAIEEELGDPVHVAAMAFRLLGCGQGSWCNMPRGGLHRTALDLLKAATRETRGSALELVAADPNGWEGAVGWLLYHGGPDSVPAQVLAECAGSALRHALSHPRHFNRRHALAVLSTGDGPFVIPTLREVLNGLPLREVNPRHAMEPGGWVVRQGGQPAVPDNASDPAFAAHLLARLGDHESYAKICELALAATGPSRSVLVEAKATLERRALGDKKSSAAKLLARARGFLSSRARRSDDGAQGSRRNVDGEQNDR